jgi:cytochrome c
MTMTMLSAIPIPRDIPLPMPTDEVVLQGLIVLLFLVHILFVALMVGGSILSVGFEFTGWRRRNSGDAEKAATAEDYDTLAREIGKTITVNKSLAVVLGVAPLLAINALYTVYFYSSNALTGIAWISIIPLVAIAFLLAYAHKYSWDAMVGERKLMHIILGAIPLAIFLFVPLIFLANINLMLFPEKWTEVQGFFSALLLNNALPRYLHFLFATVLLTALFLILQLTRSGYPAEQVFEHFDRAKLRRIFFVVALIAVLGQFGAGPLVLFTLPWFAVTKFMLGVIVVGAVLAVIAFALIYGEVIAPSGKIGSKFMAVVTLLMCTGFCMGYGRHLYREGAVQDHRQLMAKRTHEFGWSSLGAEAIHGLDAVEMPIGERIFKTTCSGCHMLDRQLVGPSVLEIASIYPGDPAGIARWTRNPQKKRLDIPEVMPAFNLPEEQLLAIGQYMLDLAAAAQAPSDGEAASGDTGADDGTDGGSTGSGSTTDGSKTDSPAAPDNQPLKPATPPSGLGGG